MKHMVVRGLVGLTAPTPETGACAGTAGRSPKALAGSCSAA